MGKAAAGFQSDFDLLPYAVDYLTCTAKAKMPFTHELRRSLSTQPTGPRAGMFSAAQLGWQTPAPRLLFHPNDVIAVTIVPPGVVLAPNEPAGARHREGLGTAPAIEVAIRFLQTPERPWRQVGAGTYPPQKAA